MHSQLEKILNLYGEGASIKDICLRMGVSRKEVLSDLRDYRESQLEKGQYSDELMMLVASRDSSDAKRKDIMSELGISRSFMVRAINEYGFLTKSRERDEEHYYMNVCSSFEFKECPKCKSNRINSIQDGDGDSSPGGIYCMSCGSEFTLRDGVVNIVKWEYVN